MKLQLFRCNVCGKLIVILSDSITPTICCGRKMQEADPYRAGNIGSEKHLPVMRLDGNKILVRVSGEAHPMTEEHQIEWIGMQTNQGFQLKKLKARGKAHACFSINDEERIEALYDFCNKHGLWCMEKESKK